MLLKKKRKSWNQRFVLWTMELKSPVLTQDSEGEVKLQGLQKSVSEFRQPKITHK